jgi:hypothetical protein
MKVKIKIIQLIMYQQLRHVLPASLYLKKIPPERQPE